VKVEVCLFATLGRYLPAGVSGDRVTLEVPDRTTVGQIMASLRVPEDLDRLQVNATFQEVLAVPVRKVTIPVAAGRNLAVLVEAAVRNFVLNQRGIDSTKEFIERQQKLMDEGQS